ncbi:GNAT family N-acetyltransferase [Myxococcota bacterium]|nr:GNAT family N-acetyltransferase [Myxococcota bacterium]
MAWRIEPLDKRTHDRASFSCGKPELDDYLKQIARKAAATNTGRTWVAVDPGQPRDTAGKQAIAGYYTVSMSSIDLSVIPGGRRDLPAQVPTALIGRLAVDERYQRQRLGELLLSDALRRICQAAEHVAADAIVLDALDDDAKQFYERYGFLELTDDPLHLFLPLASARGLFPAE